MKVPGQPQPALWAVEVEGPITPDRQRLVAGVAARRRIDHASKGLPRETAATQVSGNKVIADQQRQAGLRRCQRHATGEADGHRADTAVARWASAPRAPTRADRLLGRPDEARPGRRRRRRPDGRLRSAEATLPTPRRLRRCSPGRSVSTRRARADSSSHDPMFQSCKPPGGPRQFQQLVSGLQFVEQPISSACSSCSAAAIATAA